MTNRQTITGRIEQLKLRKDHDDLTDEEVNELVDLIELQLKLGEDDHLNFDSVTELIGKVYKKSSLFFVSFLSREIEFLDIDEQERWTLRNRLTAGYGLSGFKELKQKVREYENRQIDEIIKNAKPVEAENIDIEESEEQESITDEKLLPVTPFPFDVFSEELQNLIDKISHCYQVEPSMVASVMLPLVGGAIGNAIRVSPKKGWNESPFIWMAIIAETGHGKSPIIKALTKPIIHAQGEAQQEYQDELADYEADLKKFNCLNKNEQASQKTPTKPILRHYMVSDSTVEALGSVFEVTPRGVNIIWDELSGWLNSLNQYKTKAGNDRQHFLSLWNPEPWKIDRKITGSKFIQNTGATVFLAGYSHELSLMY